MVSAGVWVRRNGALVAAATIPGFRGQDGAKGDKGDTGAVVPRLTASVTTPALADGARWAGTIPMSQGYRLYSIQTSVAARVRLYATALQRDADLNRLAGYYPTGNHGLMFEYITVPATLTAALNPLVDGANFEAVPKADIPITIGNKSGAAAAVTVTLIYAKTE